MGESRADFSDARTHRHRWPPFPQVKFSNDGAQLNSPRANCAADIGVGLLPAADAYRKPAGANQCPPRRDLVERRPPLWRAAIAARPQFAPESSAKETVSMGSALVWRRRRGSPGFPFCDLSL